MKFEKALADIKEGKRVTRASWIGQNKFIFLVPGSKFKVNRPPLNVIYEEGTTINYQPHIDIAHDVDKVSVWAPTSDDLLAEDYCLYEL